MRACSDHNFLLDGPQPQMSQLIVRIQFAQHVCGQLRQLWNEGSVRLCDALLQHQITNRIGGFWSKALSVRPLSVQLSFAAFAPHIESALER